MTEEDLDLADARLLEDLQEELDVGAEGKENVLPFGDLGSADVTEVKPDSSSSTRVKPGKISKKILRKPLLHKAIAKLETPTVLHAENNKEPDAVKIQSPRKSKANIIAKQNVQQPIAPDPDILVAIMSSSAEAQPAKAKSAAEAKKRGPAKKGLKEKVKEDKSKTAAQKQRKARKGSAKLAEEDITKGQETTIKGAAQASKTNTTAEGGKQYKNKANENKVKAVPAQDLPNEPSPQKKVPSKSISEASETNATDAEAKVKSKPKGIKGKMARGKAPSGLAKAGKDTKQDHADIEGETEEDEAERENCDWEKHPAEAIIASTWHNKLIVKRKGTDLTEYGLVDAARVKRQRLDKHTDGPVSLQMLEEFEAWEADFKRSVSENTIDGALELDDLGKSSPLISCYYLGKMLEADYPLSRAQKGVDPSRKFPVMALSKISQRLLNLATDRATRAEAEVELLRQQVLDLEAARAYAG